MQREWTSITQPLPQPAAPPAPDAPARMTDLDLVRGLACFGIVFVHVMARYMVLDPASGWTRYYHLGDQVFKFSTQVFVFISGAVLFYVYGRRQTGYGEYLGRRVRGTIVPFLLWGLFYQLWNLHYIDVPYWATLQTGFFWRHVLSEVLIGNAYYHLYFVFMIVQLYLLYPWLARAVQWAFDRNRVRLLALAAASLTVALTTLQFYYIGLNRRVFREALGDVWFAEMIKTLLHYTDRNALFWLGFFLLGGILGAARLRGIQLRWPAWWKPGLAAAAILAALLLEYRYLVRQHWSVEYVASTVKPAVTAYSLAMIVLLLAVSQPLAARRGPGYHLLRQVAAHSMGIYLIHPLMLDLVGDYLLPTLPGMVSGPGAIAAVALVFAGSFLLSAALSRLPCGDLLVGTGARRAN